MADTSNPAIPDHIKERLLHYSTRAAVIIGIIMLLALAAVGSNKWSGLLLVAYLSSLAAGFMLCTGFDDVVKVIADPKMKKIWYSVPLTYIGYVGLVCARHWQSIFTATGFVILAIGITALAVAATAAVGLLWQKGAQFLSSHVPARRAIFRANARALSYTSSLAIMLAYLAALIFFPNGPGDWLGGFLRDSYKDANLGTQGASFLQLVNCILYVFFVVLLLPRMVAVAGFLSSFLQRWSANPSIGRIYESALETLRLPTKHLPVTEELVWLKNSARTFWYITFCYVFIFCLGAFVPGPVRNWLSYGSHWRVVGLQAHIFVASLAAMYGCVPFAVGATTFLPARKQPEITINADGLMLPSGIRPSWMLSPLVDWTRIRGLTITGNDKQPLDKRYIRIQLNLGSVKIRVRQLGKDQLLQLILAIDEFADHCKIDDSAMAVYKQLADSMPASTASMTGTADPKHAAKFKATIFTPLAAGSLIEGHDLRIVRQIASRPLSAVYLARTADQALVILKQYVMPNQNEENLRQQHLFLREYELLKKLNHDRIAKVIDVFENEQGSFLVLEKSAGTDLRSLVERLGPRSESTVLDWAEQIAGIMQHLHNQSPPILHRDLTPDNIVVDDHNRISLIDFGAAHQFIEGVTGTVIGKQSYVPPEQLRGKAVQQSDIYSFGATLSFLLTGEDPKPLMPANPANASPQLLKLIAACTQFESSERPSSFDEILESLNAPVVLKMPTAVPVEVE